MGENLQRLAFLLAVFLASGCSMGPTVDPSHYILVHKEGYPINQQREGLNDDAFRTQYIDKILAGIDAYASNLWDHPVQGQAPRLLIYVHGGLNTYKAGFDQLSALLRAQTNPERYPRLASAYVVSVNWNSSLFSSLWDDLFIIRRGERDPWGGAFTAPFVFVEHLAESVVRIPRALWYQGENAVDSFRRDTINNESRVDTVIAAGWYGLMYPVRMVSLPFIQGYGRPAWDMMKRRNDLVVAHPGTLKGTSYTEEGAGHFLFDALQARIPKPGHWSTASGRTGRLDLMLVGHSMGTMVLSRVLQSYPKLYVDHVVYLGAAASLEDFDTELLGYLRGHPDAKFWNFSLSNLDEARESGFLDLYERGSLLVWIDNLFEPVLTPMQRRLGRYRNYDKYYRLSDEMKGQVCMIRFPGTSKYPRTHGEFNDPPKLEDTLRIVDAGKCPPDF